LDGVIWVIGGFGVQLTEQQIKALKKPTACKVARRASRLHSVSQPPIGLEKRSARTERRTSGRQFFAV
jgi:hypothetical protein